MKISHHISIQVSFIFSIFFAVQAQTTWINAIPTLYHPSFAGSTDQWRIATNSSINYDQYPSLNGNLKFESLVNQNMVSVDKFVGKIHTGIGVGIRYSKELKPAPYEKMDFLEGNIVIAPKFSRNGKYTISPSLQFTMGQNNTRIKYDAINFADSLEYRVTFNEYRKNTSLKGGLMFNSRKFFIGASYYFIFKNTTNYGYPGYGSFYSLNFLERFTLISGYTFRKSEQSNFSFTPVLVFGSNSFQWNTFLMEEHHANLFGTIKYKKFTAGLDLRLNFMLGVESKRFRLMLVQHYKGGTISNYCAQISMRYLIGNMTMN